MGRVGLAAAGICSADGRLDEVDRGRRRAAHVVAVAEVAERQGPGRIGPDEVALDGVCFMNDDFRFDPFYDPAQPAVMPSP
jgi:hypothetical protein